MNPIKEHDGPKAVNPSVRRVELSQSEYLRPVTLFRDQIEELANLMGRNAVSVMFRANGNESEDLGALLDSLPEKFRSLELIARYRSPDQQDEWSRDYLSVEFRYDRPWIVGGEVYLYASNIQSLQGRMLEIKLLVDRFRSLANKILSDPAGKWWAIGCVVTGLLVQLVGLFLRYKEGSSGLTVDLVSKVLIDWGLFINWLGLSLLFARTFYYSKKVLFAREKSRAPSFWIRNREAILSNAVAAAMGGLIVVVVSKMF